MSENKREELVRTVTPVGLIPLATGVAFVVMGSSSTKPCPGHPSLPIFLLIAGTLSIGLAILGLISKFIIENVIDYSRPDLSAQENAVITMYQYLGKLMTIGQFALLAAGTYIIFPLATRTHAWNYRDPEDKFYCEYGLVLFSAIYFPLMWMLLLIFAASYFIICASNTGRND